MSNLTRRLANLETIYPTHRGPLSAADQSWYAALSEPTYLAIALRFAEAIAHRRFLAERELQDFHYEGGNRVSTCGEGWCWHTTEDERTVRTMHEIDRLAGLQEIHGADEGLTAWLAEPDAADWPPLLWDTNRAAFDQQIERERRRMDSHRGATHHVAERWRADHPDWRPGLTGAEADALDTALLAEYTDSAKERQHDV